MPCSEFFFGGLWLILWVSCFFGGASWGSFHAVYLGAFGLMMMIFSPSVSLPRSWWIAAALFVVLGSAAFLPARWFELPVWRASLENAGLDTGNLVVIQSTQAAEVMCLFGSVVLGCMWIAGFRATPEQLRRWTLLFTMGVAANAICAKAWEALLTQLLNGGWGHFGFFPNRNHGATYLSLGALCGVGVTIQSLRDKATFRFIFGLISTLVCFWAIGNWSVSRSGVLLVSVGAVIFVGTVGFKYLGKQAGRALALLALAVIGVFIAGESRVKTRLIKTPEIISNSLNSEIYGASVDKEADSNSTNVEFRAPIALDTLSMIRDFKYTGVGAGQFSYVFPQYRRLTAVANDITFYHPESDWLWMVAETGVPATLCLLGLAAGALKKSFGSIRMGPGRALRSGCLAAAIIVPFHGIFDVPGHSTATATISAFLLMLSMGTPSRDRTPAAWNRFLFRFAGLGLVIWAGFIAKAEWGNGNLAAGASQEALKKIRLCVAEDAALHNKAIKDGVEYQPDQSVDPLENALIIAATAREVVPLDREIIRYQHFIAIKYDDKRDLLFKSFDLDRALDPSWVKGPLTEGILLKDIDSAAAQGAWRMALERAHQIDLFRPGTKFSREDTLKIIRTHINGRSDYAQFSIDLE